MTHRTRCKMTCQGIRAHEHQPDMMLVSFGAVWSPDTGKPDDENALYGKLTPFGTYQGSWNKAAAEQFVVGKQYYVEFFPAD